MGKLKKPVKDEKLFLLIRNFLLTYLPVQRGASGNTITAYRIALNQFLRFAADTENISVASVTFDLFSYELVTAYLSNLITEKGFSSATWNNRLAALKAFISYAAACYPEYIAVSAQLAAIKAQKNDLLSKVEYMSEEAVRVLLAQPDATTRLGLRDRAMLIFFYDTGARIQEVLSVRICDLKLDSSPKVVLHGKGNKVRTVPLMMDTAQHLKHYIAVFHEGESTASPQLLFYTERNGIRRNVCDDTVRLMMQKYADSAKAKCPEIPERVHPHLWRHTRAMHLYQHGMDLTLVSQWLGHANLETTLIYAYADTEHKRQAITRALGHSAAPGISLENYAVTDEALLKRLYGL
jgi:site-specific recombinase XerD